MANENDDLLLRIQSDVAQGVAGVTQVVQSTQQLSDQLANLINVAVDTNRQFGQLSSQASTTGKAVDDLGNKVDDAASGFTRFQATIVTINSALGLFNQVTSLVGRGVGALESITTGAAESFADFGQHIENASKTVGLSAQFYQELQVRLERLGLGADSAQQAMVFFSRALEQAREGNTALSLTFQRLQVDIDRSRGTEAIFRDTAKALAGMTDESQRVRFELELFFRSGARMGPVLAAIAAGGADASKEFERLGLVLGTGALEAATKYEAASKDLALLTGAFTNQLKAAESEALEPFIRTLAEGLAGVTPLVVAHREAMAQLAKVVISVSVGLGGLLAWKAVAFAMGTALEAIIALDQGLISLAAAEALASAGLTLLPGLLAAGATAAILFRDDIGSLIDKVAELAKSKLPDWMTALIQVGLGAFGPQVGRPGNLPGDLSTPGGGVEGMADAFTFTPDQLKKIQKSQEDLQKAFDEASVKLTEDTKGKAAGIEDQRLREVAAITQKFQQERELALQQAGPTGLSKQEDSSLAAQQQAEIAAANEKAESQRRSLSFQQGQAIAEQQIQQAQTTAKIVVQIGLDQAKAQHEAHQITNEQYIADEKAAADQIYAIDKDAIEKRMALASTATDPAKVAAENTKLEALEADHQRKLAEIDDEATKLRQKNADDEKKYLDDVAVLMEKAYGTPTTQRLAELAKAHDELVKHLQESGLTQYIAQVDAAYKQMGDDVKYGTLNIGSTIKTGVGDAFSGVILGTRKSGEEFKAFQESLTKQFSQWIAGIVTQKAGLDQTLHGNFAETIPGYAKEGASKIGSIFSNIFDWLKGGTGTGGSVSVDETGVSNSGGQEANQVGGALFGPSSSASTPDINIGGSSEGGFTAGDLGGQSNIIGGTSAFGGTAADAGAGAGAVTSSDAGGGGGLGGLGGAVASYGATVILSILGNAMQTSAWEHATASLGKLITQKDLANQLGGGGIIGGIGNLIGSVENSGQAGKFISMMVDPFGLMGKLPTILQQTQMALGALAQKLNLGDPGSFKLPRQGRSPTQAGYDALAAAGFPEPTNQLSPDESAAKYAPGSPFANPTIYAEIQQNAANAAANPLIEALRGNEAVGFGLASSRDPKRTTQISNELINNFEALGVSVGEANREMLAMAQAEGLDLTTGIESINKAYQGHKVTVDQATVAIEGWAQLWNNDLPKSIDITTIALNDFSTQAGEDIDAFTKDIQTATNVVQGLNFSGAIGGALTSSNSKTFSTTLAQGFGQTVTQAVSDAVSKSPGFSKLFAAPVTDITEAVKSFTSGDFTTANEDMQKAGDSWAAALSQGTDFIDQLMKASPALEKAIQDAKDLTDASAVLGSALSTALSPLTDPNTAVERNAQQQRINDLEFAISRAKAFGDEITASQLQMQLATEQAAQQAAGGSNTAANFMAQIRQGVKQKVIDDLINALVTANGGILAAFMGVVAAQSLDMASNPGNIAMDMKNIATAWEATAPALGSIMDNLASFAPQIVNSFDMGGMVPGPMGLPQLAIVHGGERVLTPAQQTSTYAPSIQIVVTGNTLLNARDLSDLATMIGTQSLRHLQQNLPIAHGRR